MIEKVVRDYLQNLLSVPVYIGEQPNKHPSDYVLIQVLDIGRENHISAITLNFRSFSTSLLKATELNNSVLEKMFNIVSIDGITKTKCGGGGQNIDTTTKTYSCECVFNLFYYAEV